MTAGPPPRSRGLIALDPAACTSCMLCARECPDWCIHISSHAEAAAASPDPAAREAARLVPGSGSGDATPVRGRSGPPAQGTGRTGRSGAAGRAPIVHRLDRFAIDFGLCLYCGICVEACPFDALFWAPASVPPGTLVDLLAEADRLDGWRADVPAPAPLEAGAVPPAPKDSGRGHGGGRRARG